MVIERRWRKNVNLVSNNLLDAALSYLEKFGFSVIPIKPNKKPFISWTEFQKRKPSPTEVRSWWTKWPRANVGIVTGTISRIIVFDEDGPEAQAFIKEQGGFPITPQSKTHKGHHYFLKYPPELRVSNSSNKKLLLDVRGNGGYIVAPPSIHPSGHQYRWVDGLSLFDVEPAPLRPWMVQYLKDHFNGGENRIEIKSSSGDWEKAKKAISTHPHIMFHLMTPKPEDRSGHDWRLACLCVEEGITDPELLYQIIFHNPHGKAVSHPGTTKYIQDLVSGCLSQFKVERIETNRFPRDTIQGLAKEFADTYSDYLESPWEFWAFSFLTCLGSMLASRLTLDSAIRPQPRLFAFLLGESAVDRKSESIKQAVDFYSESFPDDFSPCFGVGSAEGLAEWLAKHPPTLLLYDEAKVFVSKAIIESSVLLPCVNTLFESNRFHSHTKGHSIKVDSGYLSILAASTTDTFQRMWTPAFTDIGFLNRLWLVPGKAERRFSIPKCIPEERKSKLKEKLVSLVNAIPKTLRSLEITPEAYGIFNDWYNNVTRSSIFTKRLDTYGHRLMVLFCANENKAKVTPDITERVVSLLEWQYKVRKEYDPIDAEGKVARVEQNIRRVLNSGPLRKRDLQRKVHYDRYGLFIFNAALQNLLEEREVAYDHKSKVYRKAQDDD
jgi:hypothetical protein